MPQKMINQALGLHSFKNELTHKDGALIKADNVVIDKDHTIESRRGFKLYSDEFGISTDRAKQLMQYKGRILVHYAQKLLFDDGAGTLSEFNGNFSEASSTTRMSGVEHQGNFYFTTDEGVKKISATDPSEFSTAQKYINDAGIPSGLDIITTLSGTGAFLENDKMTSYRVLWGRKDANNIIHLGSPGALTTIRNAAGTTGHDGSSKSVALEITIPDEIIDYYDDTGNNDYFYQVYRDEQKDNTVGGELNVPSDEMNLVIEDFPTSTDFTNRYVTTEDVTPESFRNSGTILYTNGISGEGILQANTRPPLCNDIELYKTYMFYSNTKTRHQLQLSILAVDDFTTGSTEFYIGDSSGYETYYAEAAETIGSQEFKVETGGSPSQNIDETARSLVRVINRNTSGRTYAQYISGANDVPGLILLERRDSSNTPFYLGTNDASAGNDISPKIPVVTPSTPFTSSVDSDNEVSPNRIFYSKGGIPEAVPIVNYFDVGSKDKPILRIVALRDSLFILKTDGIYRLSGQISDNFTVTLFDSSSPIIAPDSVAVLNNQVYALSNQGVITITESGVSVISRNIEDLILEPTSAKYPDFSTQSFGFASESDRAYFLFLPTLTNDTTATQCFRYNVFTKTWTRWVMSKTCGLVNTEDDKIYFGPSDTNQVEIERKNFERQDYADREFIKSLPNNSINGNIITPNSLDNIEIDDVIYQEQYITIRKFNRILEKLDRDMFLSDTDYQSTLETSTGSDMGVTLQSLIVKINADDATQSYTAYNASNDIEDLRDGFNNLIDELNTSAGVFYEDYIKYTELLSFETIITDIDKTFGTITTEYEMPFLINIQTLIFKGIPVDIEYAAETLGDASLRKQIRTASLQFDQLYFTKAKIGFRSDISGDLETQEFEGEGNGAFGMQVYGAKIYGGSGGERPFRTWVPRNKQRCRFIYVSFQHGIARENFELIGYSLTYNSKSSPRAYQS